MLRILFSILSVLFLSLPSFSQSDSLTVHRYPLMVDAFNRAYPQEKAYLHFDNTGYFIGETVHFKAYVVDCSIDSLSRLSRILYVELVSPGGDVLETRKVRLENGLGVGDIKLDNVLTSGFYEIRAYTRWMTNWGEEACFSRVFPIFGRPRHEGDYSNRSMDDNTGLKRLPDMRDTKEDKSSDYNIGIYPEGGHFVEGLVNRVAFQVTDEYGRPLACSGVLLSAEGDTVCRVETVHSSRGVFVCNGIAGLSLEMQDSSGVSFSRSLPEPEKSGCAFRVVSTNTEMVNVEASFSSDMYGKDLGFTIIHNGGIIAFHSFTAGKEPSRFRFSGQSMPEGVSELMVYDASGRILADRLLFVLHELSEQDSIRVVSSSSNLQPCGLVSLDVFARPDTEISLSAIDAETMTCGNALGVRQWKLLSSEVRGYIENAGYYVESDDAEHRVAQDLLMMVQGWRRYDWKVMSGQTPFKISELCEDGMYLSGSLYPTSKKAKVGGVNIDAVLYNSAGQVLRGHAVSDSTGYYSFSLPDCFGRWNLILQAGKDKESRYSIGIDRSFSPKEKRAFAYSETELISPPDANLLTKSGTVPEYDSISVLAGDSSKILPDLSVEGRRPYDDARKWWESESYGRSTSKLYYDCEKECAQIVESGGDVPEFQKWLMERNEFFDGMPRQVYYDTFEDGKNNLDTIVDAIKLDEQIEVLIKDLHNYDRLTDGRPVVKPEEEKYTSALHDPVEDESIISRPYKIYNDGLGYKNKPVVWVVDNRYFALTNMPKFTDKIEIVAWNMGAKNSTSDMPVLLDEVKSVYISEDVSECRKYVNLNVLDRVKPVTVFVYTNHASRYKKKGVRRTYFQGYNIPKTFEMKDYSILPPMDDFRRTIFWAPSVKTDKNGHATVEFYNNSTCREMYISAECITDDGCALSN